MSLPMLYDDDDPDKSDSETCDLISSQPISRPPWWNRRTRLERIFCSTAVVLLAACIALGLFLAVLTFKFNQYPDKVKLNVSPPETAKFVYSGKDSKSCQTRGCVKAAAGIIENLDETINPCNDFYHFACGNWIKRRIIPEDKSGLSVFSELTELLSKKINVLIDDMDPKLLEIDVFQKIQNMYSSCMNTDLIEEKKIEPLLKTLNDFGGYPVLLSNWKEEDFDWTESLIKMREIGYDQDIFADISVVADTRNSTSHIIDIDQTDLGMPGREYYMRGLNDSNVQAYYDLMVDSAVLLGAEENKAKADLMEVLKFEMQLANISLPKEERRNISKLYHKMTIQELQVISPDIQWLKILKEIIRNNVTIDEKILVNVPNFIKGLNEIMKSTKKRILANYMMWRVTLQSIGNLDERFRKLIQQYSKSLTGTKVQPARWKQCLGRLGGCLSTAVSALYVRNHFSVSNKHAAEELVEALLEEYKNILNNAEWMGEETKNKALEKAKSIVSHIGFPEELLDDDKLNDYCQPLDIEKDNLFGNSRAIYRTSVDYSFNKLRKPVDKMNWIKNSKAAVVNAYYSVLTNSISFPAGILQGLFFDPLRPTYMNFGAIGFIIGHEITHGFDDIGRQFDMNGNNINWWDKITNEKFHRKAQCFIHQYGNFTVPTINMNVNGINTQGENIADNGGLKEAYLAYERFERENGPEQILPSLNYTSRQLFWISAAQIWCAKYRPKTLALSTLTGVHSPNIFRVNGAFSNQPYFIRDFNCPANSPMNPSKKCSVW